MWVGVGINRLNLARSCASSIYARFDHLQMRHVKIQEFYGTPQMYSKCAGQRSNLPRCKPRSRDPKWVKNNNFYGTPPPKVRQRGGSSGRMRGGVEIGKMMKVGDFIIRRRLDQCHSMFSLNCQMAPGASIVRHKVALGILSHADTIRNRRTQADTCRLRQTQVDTGRDRETQGDSYTDNHGKTQTDTGRHMQTQADTARHM